MDTGYINDNKAQWTPCFLSSTNILEPTHDIRALPAYRKAEYKPSLSWERESLRSNKLYKNLNDLQGLFNPITHFKTLVKIIKGIIKVTLKQTNPTYIPMLTLKETLKIVCVVFLYFVLTFDTYFIKTRLKRVYEIRKVDKYLRNYYASKNPLN